MKKLLTLLAFAGFSFLMSNCSSSKSGAAGAMSDEAKVAAVKKNFTPTQLEEGKTLWQGSCGKCHKLYAPDSRSVEKWERVLPRMFNRSKMTEEQGNLVRAYLLSQVKLS